MDCWGRHAELFELYTVFFSANIMPHNCYNSKIFTSTAVVKVSSEKQEAAKYQNGQWPLGA